MNASKESEFVRINFKQLFPGSYRLQHWLGHSGMKHDAVSKTSTERGARKDQSDFRREERKLRTCAKEAGNS